MTKMTELEIGNVLLTFLKTGLTRNAADIECCAADFNVLDAAFQMTVIWRFEQKRMVSMLSFGGRGGRIGRSAFG